MNRNLTDFKDEEYCYLTTTGRKTGNPREIEIWFGVIGNSIYMLSGGREKSDWVKNLMQTPQVTVRIAGQIFNGIARVETTKEEDESARLLVTAKYHEREEDDSMSEWGRTALVVAVDV